jgi:DNA-binding MarR family transcriptional regulator
MSSERYGRLAAPATVAFARRLIRAERLRHSKLEEHFSPGEWQILLELFVAVEEGRKTAVSDIGLIEGIARSTALGIAADMTRKGYLLRKADPADGRRFFLSIDGTLHRRINALLLSIMLYLRGSDSSISES